MAVAQNVSLTLPRGNRHPNYAPHGCYPCRGEDAWVVISIDSDTAWKNWCLCADLPQLAADDRYATLEGRRTHHDELDRMIEQWTANRDKMDVMTQLQAVGVSAGPVMNTQDLYQDTHLGARDFFIPSSDGANDPVFPGVPFQLSPGITECRPGPTLGEDNRDVTVNLLGRPESDVRVVSEAEIGTDFDISKDGAS